MPESKSNNGFSGMGPSKAFGSSSLGFGTAKDPDFGPSNKNLDFDPIGSEKGASFEPATPSTHANMAEDDAKITLPNIAEVEKSYAADNRAIEQCEDEALEALFGKQITGRLQDPQNAQVLEKLNELVDRFNTTSARLEKIERGCQLLSEGLLPRQYLS